jgi:hypothetical protein
MVGRPLSTARGGSAPRDGHRTMQPSSLFRHVQRWLSTAFLEASLRLDPEFHRDLVAKLKKARDD